MKRSCGDKARELRLGCDGDTRHIVTAVMSLVFVSVTFSDTRISCLICWPM